MHIPMYDEVVQGYLADRRREVEIDRMLKGCNNGSSIKLKVSVLISGAALAPLMIAQIV